MLRKVLVGDLLRTARDAVFEKAGARNFILHTIRIILRCSLQMFDLVSQGQSVGFVFCRQKTFDDDGILVATCAHVCVCVCVCV